MSCQDENMKKIVKKTIKSLYNTSDPDIIASIYCLTKNREIRQLLESGTDEDMMKVDEFLNHFIQYDHKWLFNTFLVGDIRYERYGDGRVYAFLSLSANSNNIISAEEGKNSTRYPATKEIHYEAFVNSLDEGGILYKVLHRLDGLIEDAKLEICIPLIRKHRFILTLPLILNRCRSVRMKNLTQTSVELQNLLKDGYADAGYWPIDFINTKCDHPNPTYSHKLQYTGNNENIILDEYYWDGETNICDPENLKTLEKQFVDDILAKVNNLNLQNLEFEGFYFEEMPTLCFTPDIIKDVADYIHEKGYKFVCSPIDSYCYYLYKGNDGVYPSSTMKIYWPKDRLSLCGFDDMYVQNNWPLRSTYPNYLSETIHYVNKYNLGTHVGFSKSGTNNAELMSRLQEILDKRDLFTRNVMVYSDYDGLQESIKNKVPTIDNLLQKLISLNNQNVIE